MHWGVEGAADRINIEILSSFEETLSANSQECKYYTSEFEAASIWRAAHADIEIKFTGSLAERKLASFVCRGEHFLYAIRLYWLRKSAIEMKAPPWIPIDTHRD